MKPDPVTPGDFDVYCEWGPAGLRHLSAVCHILVIIDVLSFTTSVDIAVSRGAVIFPYPARDEGMLEYARSRDAQAAGAAYGSRFSLSPSSLLEVPAGTRLVLASPNGAALSYAAAAPVVLAACLRNAAAVAGYARSLGGPVGLLPAGERWGDGSLRPSVEDWICAGALASHLPGRLAPEAGAAQAAYFQARDGLPGALLACASGRELVGKGREADVHLAAALDCSRTVPLLVESGYRSAGDTIDG